MRKGNLVVNTKGKYLLVRLPKNYASFANLQAGDPIIWCAIEGDVGKGIAPSLRLIKVIQI
jgi:hypothetical protein